MTGSRYGTLFCGGGPAATGVIVCAAAEGRLDELLSEGVCILEQGDVIGPGALGRYRLSANTQGATFMQFLETAEPRAAFDRVRVDASTQLLARLPHEFPFLPLVGRHLEAVGLVVRSLIEAAPGGAVLTRHSVRELRLLADGGVAVSADPVDGGAPRMLMADRAVLAMGGVPPTDLDQLEVLPGLLLGAYRDKLCHADALIDDRVGLIEHLRRAVGEAGEVVVVGGSHSAWSAAWRMTTDPNLRAANGRPPKVTVLHRSPLRFHFPDESRALADGYPLDRDQDVCPHTGVVNRHSGLRSDARALAWSVIRGGHPEGSVSAVQLVDQPECRAAVERALGEAGAIIAAVGYRPRLPTLRWPDGRLVDLAKDGLDGYVTEGVHLVSVDGAVLPELLAFGLGAGLRATGELAGEPAFAGRLDAVRLYQAEGGRLVLGSLLGQSQS